MFERYTEKARRVIFFARYEASQYGSPYIETEHVLLGVIREDPNLTSVVLPSKTSIDAIREQINEHTTSPWKTSTSADLPLSNESKRVLAYGAEEADRLRSRDIGSEHLLLGLLREKSAFAAQLLHSQGLCLDRAREIVSERQKAAEAAREIGKMHDEQWVSLDRARQIVSKWQKTAEAAREIVEIHGEQWDVEHVHLRLVQLRLVELRKFAWRKRQWKPLDMLVEIGSGRIFLDMTLKDDLGFKLVASGWAREFCSLCHWELNTDGGPEHAVGYTNGREWVCTECYERFIEPLDKARE